MNENPTQNKSSLDLPTDTRRDLVQSWPELFSLTEHWQSDMKFFRDELNFLNILIDKHLIKLVEEDNVSTIAPLAITLSKFEKRSVALDQRIAKHLQHIQGLIENPFSHDSRTSQDEHLELEKDLVDFVKEFRIIKSEIFSVVERALKSEKAKRLLQP
jgi:hypothetical protein